MAPCNCGGQNGARVKYVYVDANGRSKSYTTELEAKAAKIRAGNGGSIRTEPA
jgi:hypothetical protein